MLRDVQLQLQYIYVYTNSRPASNVGENGVSLDHPSSLIEAIVYIRL